jgi:hypothetical protein
MQVHQRVVAHDVGLVRLDEADAAHVRGQVVDLVDVARGLETGVEAPQVEALELVGAARLELRRLQVDAAHPVAVGDEEAHQVVADEAAGAGDEHARALGHGTSSGAALTARARRRRARGRAGGRSGRRSGD